VVPFSFFYPPPSPPPLPPVNFIIGVSCNYIIKDGINNVNKKKYGKAIRIKKHQKSLKNKKLRKTPKTHVSRFS
jgi:hypothetical protein